MAAAVNILEGLKILLKYDSEAEVEAQHDELLAGGPAPEKIDKEDRSLLENLGWSYDVRQESWYHFT